MTYVLNIGHNSTRISNYLERIILSNSTRVMSMVDPVATCIETSKIDNDENYVACKLITLSSFISIY